MAKRTTKQTREFEVSNIDGKRVVRMGASDYRGELDGQTVCYGSTAFEVETELNRLRYESISR